MTNNIRRLRLERGLTQSELGKKLGVTKGTVYTWENGKREPSAAAVEKMCGFFSITRAELYMSEAEMVEKIPRPGAAREETLRFILENEKLCLWVTLLSATDNAEKCLFSAAEEIMKKTNAMKTTPEISKEVSKNEL